MDLQVHTKYALKMALNDDPQIGSPFVFQLTPVSSYREEAIESENSLRLPVWPFYTTSLRQIAGTSEVDFKPAGFGMTVTSSNVDAQKKKKPYTRKLKRLDQPTSSMQNQQQPATPVLIQQTSSTIGDIDFNALFGDTLKDTNTLAQISAPDNSHVQITPL